MDGENAHKGRRRRNSDLLVDSFDEVVDWEAGADSDSEAGEDDVSDDASTAVVEVADEEAEAEDEAPVKQLLSFPPAT